jgi:hypothetical protein
LRNSEYIFLQREKFEVGVKAHAGLELLGSNNPSASAF